MRSTLFKTLSIVALAFTLGACSADSDVKDDGDPRPGNPTRKPSQEEMARLMKVATTMDGMELADYPVARVFGTPDSGDNAGGEKMFALLKDCTVGNTQTETNIDQSLSGTCPIDYKNTEKYSQADGVSKSEVIEQYNVRDASYVIAGHMLSFEMFGLTKFSNTNLEAKTAGQFNSKAQGQGSLTFGISMTSTQTSETHADFFNVLSGDFYYGKEVCFGNDKKSSCLPGIKVSIETKGYVEIVNGEIVMKTTYQGCFLDGVEFDCTSGGALQKLNAQSVRTAKQKTLEVLRAKNQKSDKYGRSLRNKLKECLSKPLIPL